MKLRARSSRTRGYVVGTLIALGASAWWTEAAADGLPGKWVEVRSPHFVVASNAGRRPARRTAEHFEQIRELFVQALPGRTPESAPPLEVFAVRGERTMKRLLPWYWERKDRAKPAGAFRSTASGTYAVVRVDLLEGQGFGTVYHEYFHFLSHATRAKVPVWVEEGLASYWGSTRLTAKAAEVGRPDARRLDQLRWGRGRFLPLDELMAVDRSSPHYSQSEKAWQFYAQSWALVHYLLIGDRTGQGQEQLVDYLRRVGAGEPAPAAASTAFGDLEELESRLRAYVRKLLFHYAVLPPPAVLPPEKFQIRELPAAEAAARAALFQLESGWTGGVDELVAVALEGAPQLAEAHTAAGILQLLTRETEQAEQTLQRATSLEGASPLASYGLALARFQQDRTPEGLAAVEQPLARAIALHPEFTAAKARLAEVYRRLDGCSQRAYDQIRDARVLAPDFQAYWLKEAQVLMQCRKVEEARAIVKRVIDEAADAASASRDNEICWKGSLWGLEREVLPACDRGVAAEPEDYAILDSRAVARAIAGDLKGAADDLRSALKLAGDVERDDFKARRETWLGRLESGENPLAGDDLASFRDDPEESGLQWGL